jgi:hypothetical protein
MRPVRVKGFRIDKAGKVEKDPRRMSVSARLKEKGSKRIRVRRKGE